ncbi:pilus assembly protein TadB [Altericroceibacterium spongiae]|uniref:Pilus assembly protein TadB n=1 Tax=Altericroceibacterium spongiae TaxID=2320269 RepID=A0A420EK96_9SPHN|nr:type II secretion system F family protein [Altericroceibacterium spongiae]RKF21119.1 pilus assembly protein TadB [Altericroceibacterium spongiae]
METIQLILIGLGLLLGLVLVYLLLGTSSPDKESQRRLRNLRIRHSDNPEEKVESQLKKAIAARRPKRHHAAGQSSRLKALELRLQRTGKGWSLQQYFYASGGLALVVMLLTYFESGAFLLSLLLGVLIGAGLPHMAVGYFINKRVTDFIVKFPDGIDLIVRGLRAGLPVAETLTLISHEIPGAVGEEFRAVSERIRIGRTMEEALQETATKLALPEFQFFVITLAIQRETGGNLSETLKNLSDVLRKRSQMKLKIKAMSSEAKASAYIIGALPFLVFAMLMTLNPEYMTGFFTDDRLILTGLGGLTWMGLGVFIMSKMVRFEI